MLTFTRLVKPFCFVEITIHHITSVYIEGVSLIIKDYHIYGPIIISGVVQFGSWGQSGITINGLSQLKLMKSRVALR